MRSSHERRCFRLGGLKNVVGIILPDFQVNTGQRGKQVRKHIGVHAGLKKGKQRRAVQKADESLRAFKSWVELQ